MNWTSIRLEHGRTREFPAGSASRTYLLCLPLDEDGRIDEAALRRTPARATVRRFWPSQPDLSGHVTPTAGGWTFSYEHDSELDRFCRLEAVSLRTGDHLTLSDLQGQSLPFVVANIGGG